VGRISTERGSPHAGGRVLSFSVRAERFMALILRYVSALRTLGLTDTASQLRPFFLLTVLIS
jgi:hypothetical protein